MRVRRRDRGLETGFRPVRSRRKAVRPDSVVALATMNPGAETAILASAVGIRNRTMPVASVVAAAGWNRGWSRSGCSCDATRVRRSDLAAVGAAMTRAPSTG